MLTRLQISGFKNLVDVDVKFGAFNCIAGANGVGKSNLFDAIKFLSALADRTFIEAAQSIRDEDGRIADVSGIFRRGGANHDKMSFIAEMIVPQHGTDDLGQPAEATITFLRYRVVLAYRDKSNFDSSGPIELIEEALTHINRNQAHKHLLFDHSASLWRESVLIGRRNKAPFISTNHAKGVINLHQDGGSSGRPPGRAAHTFPRTLISTANASESPTALLARREMQSWKLLQLEPAALRQSNDFNSPMEIAADGSFMAATLYRLAQSSGDEQRVYAQVTNRLAKLLENVHSLWVERDEKRQVYTIYLRQTDGTVHPARDLSDGTLRFLALTIMEMDAKSSGLICLEEPENGIDPRRIPNMLQLLRDIAVDVNDPVDEDNPMRQVIINTHSPSVIQQVPDDSVLVAELKELAQEGERIKGVQFGALPDEENPQTGDMIKSNWRLRDKHTSVVPKGRLIAYLSPVPRDPPPDATTERRVIDRHDVRDLMQQLELPFQD